MAKDSASKPAAESKDSTASKATEGPKPTVPKVMSNKRRGYGINDPAFKWQLGGLIAGVAVAILASTQQGKQERCSNPMPKSQLHVLSRSIHVTIAALSKFRATGSPAEAESCEAEASEISLELALRYVGLEDAVLRLMHGRASRSLAEEEAPVKVAELPQEPKVPIPSLCLSQSCKVKVFPNGEHVRGKKLEVNPADIDDLEDLGEFLGPKMECSSKGMRRDEPQYCKVYNSVGRRMRSMESVHDGDTLYVVPQERSFVWPTIEIGRKVTVPHVTTPLGAAVELETLSHSPRVFSLYNFMDPQEADMIIDDALTMTQEEYKLKRSSTGTKGRSISKTRTSDNAFVTHTATAQALKRRIFTLLGIEEYAESWADGLQVLRYNESQAYVAHYDYLEGADGHNFDSAGLGTNRFATVVLYFNDVKEGGETVFTKAPGIDHHLLPDTKVPVREVLEDLGLPRGGWEEKLLLQCRRNMVAAPRRGQAVLFYNQHPDGRKDMSVEHGACPVIRGQKWAANLWVWNGPRYGMSSVDPETGRTVDLHRSDGKVVENDPTFKIEALFVNRDVEGASLHFDTKPWANGVWRVGQEHRINTYMTHKWVARVDGRPVKTWIISQREAKQTFVLTKSDLA